MNSPDTIRPGDSVIKLLLLRRPNMILTTRPSRTAFPWLLAMTLFFMVPACGRVPTMPRATQMAARGAVPASICTMPRAAAVRVIAQLQPSVQPADVAGSYGSLTLDYIPEIRLVLLRTPTGMTDQSFQLRLAADSRVVFAEPDYEARTAETRQSTIAFSEGTRTWSDVADQTALARVGAEQAHLLTRGAGVLVAVLDTGIELDHPALSSHLSLPGIELGTVSSPGDDRAEAVDTNGDGILDGSLGHGTHVAGIVLALAPQAQILPVRVLDSDGVGHAFAIARGLVLSTKRGAGVANLSLGMPEVSNSIVAAVDYAEANGVVVVAPTGNGGSSTIDFPAAYSPVFAVAGTDSLDHKTPFSNYGMGVNIAAPACGILSTYVGGGYALWSGTSMAAPFVSGVSALTYSELGGRQAGAVATIVSAVARAALPLGSIDLLYGQTLGAGRVNALVRLSESTLLPDSLGTCSPQPTARVFQ